MRIAFTSSDIPLLKQLSYKISDLLNAYLAEEKQSRRVASNAIFASVAEFSEDQLEGYLRSLPKHLRTLFPDTEKVTEEGIYRIAIANLPDKFGSTSVQVCMAKALGYKDWGDLHSKATYCHAKSESQASLLKNIPFARPLFLEIKKQFNIEEDETGIDEFKFILEVAAFVRDNFPNIGTANEFPPEKNVYLCGYGENEIRVCVNRIQSAASQGFEVAAICSTESGVPFPVSGVNTINVSADMFLQAIKGELPNLGESVVVTHRKLIVLFGFEAAAINNAFHLFAQTRSMNVSFTLMLKAQAEEFTIAQLKNCGFLTLQKTFTQEEIG